MSHGMPKLLSILSLSLVASSAMADGHFYACQDKVTKVAFELAVTQDEVSIGKVSSSIRGGPQSEDNLNTPKAQRLADDKAQARFKSKAYALKNRTVYSGKNDAGARVDISLPNEMLAGKNPKIDEGTQRGAGWLLAWNPILLSFSCRLK